MNYPYSPDSIETDINRLIDHLEANLKVFSDKLAEKEREYPNLYYQEELYRLRCAIADLKKVRNTLGALNWI